MLGMGGATRYTVFKGQQADRAADNVFQNTLYAAAALAAAYVFAGIFFYGTHHTACGSGCCGL